MLAITVQNNPHLYVGTNQHYFLLGGSGFYDLLK